MLKLFVFAKIFAKNMCLHCNQENETRTAGKKGIRTAGKKGTRTAGKRGTRTEGKKETRTAGKMDIRTVSDKLVSSQEFAILAPSTERF